MERFSARQKLFLNRPLIRIAEKRHEKPLFVNLIKQSEVLDDVEDIADIGFFILEILPDLLDRLFSCGLLLK
jgi:hypothetical protein